MQTRFFFFFSLPNSRAETSWEATHVKLTLPVRLTYSFPASCSSGRWGHGAGATTLSSVQQLLYPAYKAMEGDRACHLACHLWAQRPSDLSTFAPYCPDVGHISAAWPLILLRTVLPRTQHSQFRGDWSCVGPYPICQALGKPPPCSLDFPLGKWQSDTEAIADKTLAHAT